MRHISSLINHAEGNNKWDCTCLIKGIRFHHWFLLGDNFFNSSGSWFTKAPKDTRGKQNFPRLSVFQTEIGLIISQMKGPVCYYAHLLGATFLNVPPDTQVFQTQYFLSLGLLNMAVSMTLAHSPVVTLS